MGERLALVEPVLAPMAGHVDQHAPADHALSAIGWTLALARPPIVVLRHSHCRLAAVPDVAEGVVLRRALQERVTGVIGVVQAARERGPLPPQPVALVEDHGTSPRRAGPAIPGRRRGSP